MRFETGREFRMGTTRGGALFSKLDLESMKGRFLLGDGNGMLAIKPWLQSAPDSFACRLVAQMGPKLQKTSKSCQMKFQCRSLGQFEFRGSTRFQVDAQARCFEIRLRRHNSFLSL